jgi:hypothetical protein
MALSRSQEQATEIERCVGISRPLTLSAHKTPYSQMHLRPSGEPSNGDVGSLLAPASNVSVGVSSPTE